ncbi:hypothetical protein [uncultured Polaribacter sp.]|uniref:hypothetical protein n=1 Tax=uncultured Polaribacter sp. TaxID=174711 RepID=UPI002633B7DB|nr:hypothetical protein [uncultured Polaribacter sp.]
MKNIILITLIFFTTISCKAQLNNLNETELFDGIKFNNISLGDIMETKGKLNEIRSLLGNSVQETTNNSGPYIGKELSNDNIVISFEDETDSGNNYDLTTIYVLNSSVIANVKGLSIKIGDSRSKFGNYYLFNEIDSSYNFTDADTGSVGLSFKIDANNKVSKIELICF